LFLAEYFAPFLRRWGLQVPAQRNQKTGFSP
jgi:hypothetical protein